MKFVSWYSTRKNETTKCFQKKECSARIGFTGDRRAEKAIEDMEPVQR